MQDIAAKAGLWGKVASEKTENRGGNQAIGHQTIKINELRANPIKDPKVKISNFLINLSEI